MESAAHTHRPDRRPNNTALTGATVVQAVVDAFAAAPVTNPAGGNGITLHAIVDDSLPEINSIIFVNRGSGANDDFIDLKLEGNGVTPGNLCGTGVNDAHFGTVADRSSANCANILGALRLTFRYTIFGHQISGLGLTSGISELPGNDFLVTLAVSDAGPANDYEDWANTLAQTYRTTFDREFAILQTGTLMHELGHSLGLRHGGVDHTNCKPNYISVMNYTRQFNDAGRSFIPGMLNQIRTDRLLDYSRDLLLTLSEATLNEGNGIGGPHGQRIVFGIGTTGNAGIGRSNGSIDWNGNTIIDSTPVASDVNFIPSINDCQTIQVQNLIGFNDWQNIVYDFRWTRDFGDGSSQTANLGSLEQNLSDYVNGSLGSVDADNDGINNFLDNCPLAPNPNQADGNGNGIGDVCDLNTTVLADVSLEKSDSVDPAQVNAPFNYNIMINNAGPSAATNVVVTDQMPAMVTINSSTTTQGSCSGTTIITCNLGSIQTGASVNITIEVQPTQAATIVNTASVTSSVGDPITLNNTVSITTAVLNPSSINSITGTVTNGNGFGIGGVSMTMDGSLTRVTNTDVNGNYVFDTLTSGGTYTITPTKVGHTFNPSSRTIINLMNNQTTNFVGVSHYQPSDFDCDGITDLAVWRSSNGTWYWLKSSDGGSFHATQWGTSGDKPVPGDYDGDGTTDLAVWRPSDGTWYWLKSSTNTLGSQQFGTSTDKPVQGDYDGDKKTDNAVFRPSNTAWYILLSANGTPTGQVWGLSTDKLVPGDYDGDGKTDIAVFRESGIWYILQSSNGSLKAQLFGQYGDSPVPAAYIPN